MIIRNRWAFLWLGLLVFMSAGADEVAAVIDTGLVAPDSLGGVGEWVDNDHVIFNVSRDGSNFSMNDRVSVIYDVVNKSHRIISDSPVICVNIGRGVIGFWRHGDLRLMRIDGGRFFDYGVGDPWVGCRSGGAVSSDVLIESLTNFDGYIEYGLSGQGAYDGPAFLVRPDGSRRALDVKAMYVGHVRYLAFMNKYLLDGSDGQMLRQGNRDFYLMSPDGDISTIPYPIDFVEKVLKNEQFNSLMPVKSGLLIYKGSRSYKSGLYLLSGGNYKKIWGGRGYYMKGGGLSPNGCRLSFTSFHDGLFGININKGAIKILDVCS